MFKYIYGPVSSWRLGHSLGIDLLSQEEKVCNFDCIYCQLGRTVNYETERKLYVSTSDVIGELKRLPPVSIDYITLSGRGEPTLAGNMGEVVEAIKRFRKEPVAVLTNSSLMDKDEVRKELSQADLVVVKLDAPSEALLNLINRPAPGISLDKILEGIRRFRGEYRTKLAIQIMFIGENENKVDELTGLVLGIQPDVVQINTPLRPSPTKPLPKETIFKIKEQFGGINILSVYNGEQRKTRPLSPEDTLKRRGPEGYT